MFKLKYIIDISEDLSTEQIEEFENAVEASHGVIIERPKEFGSSKDNLRETALLEKISKDFILSKETYNQFRFLPKLPDGYKYNVLNESTVKLEYPEIELSFEINLNAPTGMEVSVSHKGEPYVEPLRRFFEEIECNSDNKTLFGINDIPKIAREEIACSNSSKEINVSNYKTAEDAALGICQFFTEHILKGQAKTGYIFDYPERSMASVGMSDRKGRPYLQFQIYRAGNQFYFSDFAHLNLTPVPEDINFLKKELLKSRQSSGGLSLTR